MKWSDLFKRRDEGWDTDTPFRLSSGLFAVSDTCEVLFVDDLEDRLCASIMNGGQYDSDVPADMQAFIDSHPDFVMAYGYQTIMGFLLSERPVKLSPNQLLGGGFEGHGTTAIINDCPKRLLILGQND